MSLRQEIIDVSKELLLKEGFGKISMRKIAAKAGVSATSIYLYFKNKDELLLALIEESIEKLNSALKEAAEPDSGPVERLERMAMAYVKYALENPQEYEIIYMVRPEEMPKYPKEKFRQVRDTYELIASIIHKGSEKMLLEVDDPLVSAYTIWAQLHGIVSVVLNKRLDTRIPKEKFLNQAIDQIIHGFVIQRTPV